MEPSVLYHKSSAFTEHNLAHYFLLGLASLSLNLPEQFEQEAQSQTHTAGDELADDRYLHFMLGLLVTSRQLNQILAAEKIKFEAMQSENIETAVAENTANQLHHILR